MYLDYGYGYEAPPAPVSATRGRGTYLLLIKNKLNTYHY